MYPRVPLYAIAWRALWLPLAMFGRVVMCIGLILMYLSLEAGKAAWDATQ